MTAKIIAIVVILALIVATIYDIFFRLPKIREDLEEANGGFDDEGHRRS